MLGWCQTLFTSGCAGDCLASMTVTAGSDEGDGCNDGGSHAEAQSQDPPQAPPRLRASAWRAS